MKKKLINEDIFDNSYQVKIFILTSNMDEKIFLFHYTYLFHDEREKIEM